MQEELAIQDPVPKPDRLEKIKGIGPVYAGLLHDAGIMTFAQLAQQTPEGLQNIVASKENSRMVNVESWIVQAQTLADDTTTSDSG